MRCIICGKDKEEKNFSKEHIIPEALGNKDLTTFSVCKDCNSKLGDHVDSYFTNHNLIKIIRQQRKLLEKKNKPIKLFEGTMTGEDGRQYDFRNDGYHIHPTISKTTNGWTVETENPQEGLNLLRKKLQREGKNMDNLSDKVRIEKKTVNLPVIPLNADIDTGCWILFL
jgi:uncharacterized protein YlaI